MKDFCKENFKTLKKSIEEDTRWCKSLPRFYDGRITFIKIAVLANVIYRFSKTCIKVVIKFFIEHKEQFWNSKLFENMLFSYMCMFVSLHELMCFTSMQVPAKQTAPEETVVSCRGGVQNWTQILCNTNKWAISPAHQSNLKSKNLPENITIIDLTVYRVIITKMTSDINPEV